MKMFYPFKLWKKLKEFHYLPHFKCHLNDEIDLCCAAIKFVVTGSVPSTCMNSYSTYNLCTISLLVCSTYWGGFSQSFCKCCFVFFKVRKLLLQHQGRDGRPLWEVRHPEPLLRGPHQGKSLSKSCPCVRGLIPLGMGWLKWYMREICEVFFSSKEPIWSPDSYLKGQ